MVASWHLGRIIKANIRAIIFGLLITLAAYAQINCNPFSSPRQHIHSQSTLLLFWAAQNWIGSRAKWLFCHSLFRYINLFEPVGAFCIFLSLSLNSIVNALQSFHCPHCAQLCYWKRRRAKKRIGEKCTTKNQLIITHNKNSRRRAILIKTEFSQCNEKKSATNEPIVSITMGRLFIMNHKNVNIALLK